jgi:alkaline phosphatase D
MIRQQLLLSALALSAACQTTTQLAVSPLTQLGDTDRTWIGEDFFANRLQDWRIRGGRLECTVGAKKNPLRTAQLLTTALSSDVGDFSASVTTGALNDGALEAEAFHGFILGGGGEHVDYRLSAMIHSKPGEDGGVLAVLGADGQVRLHDNSGSYSGGSWSVSGPLKAGAIPALEASCRWGEGYGEAGPVPAQLSIQVKPFGDTYNVHLVARSLTDDEIFSQAIYEKLPAHQLDGCLGLVSHLGTKGSRSGFWFQDWTLDGPKLERHPERAWGPILSCQHTLSEGTLKLTAQAVPLGEGEGSEARLEIKRGSKWREVARAELTPLSYTYPFRVDSWDGSRDTPYRVTNEAKGADGKLEECTYEGVIRAIPEDITIAAFTGHKCFTGGKIRWNSDGIWFPHSELVASVKYHEPDFLFFSGDQLYEGDLVGANMPHDGDSIEDYLYKWYRWCWVFGDLTRDLPAVTIPDDHDVYHGNIWGAGGRKAVARDGMTAHDSGGYRLSGHLVNAIHRTQVSHLPDPFDPTPIEQDISVYYTNVEYGGVSFAVIADRMWKESPTVMETEGDCKNGFFKAEGFVPSESKVDAPLLGERQLSFLEAWAADWSEQALFKVVLSQTIFANVATLPPPAKTDAVTPRLAVIPAGGYPPDDMPVSDGDSNGWPSLGRDRALREIRKAFALHIAGDQHLGSTIRYGVEEWGDAGYALCVPSVANTWPRRWYPSERGANQAEGAARNTGDYLDGFGNKMTVFAASNPVDAEREPAALYNRAPGYGIVNFADDHREMTLANWPRWIDPSAADAEPYEGWPITVSLLEQYDREAVGWLPQISCPEGVEPVVRVVHEPSGETLYTLRLPAHVVAAGFRPRTFSLDPHSLWVRIGDESELRAGLMPDAAE